MTHPASGDPVAFALIGIAECAEALVAEVDRNHDTKEPPAKYMVPWRAVSDLREALRLLDPASGDHPFTPRRAVK